MLCLEVVRTFCIEQSLCFQLRQQLDDAIAGECPYCGELMISEISMPFISSNEAEEALSWEIKRRQV
jgi:hypothetical protein